MSRQNQNIKLEVGEPWDFKSPDGRALPYGTTNLVTDMGTSIYGDYMIVDTTLFELDGYKIRNLLLRRRYDNEQLASLLANRRVMVNASWLKDGQRWTHERACLEPMIRKDLVGGFIIAGATLIPE